MHRFPSLPPALAALALLAAPAWADGPAFSFKGFGTLGVVGTDTDHIGFRRDFTQTGGATHHGDAETVDIDSRLGLQVDADFNRAFHATVQWVARNHAGDFFEQNLEWAFLRWRPRDDLDIRAGRIGADAFMLSDHRNLGYAYPWMRPPHEFYALLVPYHFNGADITQRFALGEGYLSVKAYGGYSLNQMSSLLQHTRDTTLRTVLYGGNLTYESGDWRARLGYAQVDTLNDLGQSSLYQTLEDPLVNLLWPGAQSLIPALKIEHKQIHYGSVGLAYDDGLWQIQTEASYAGSSNIQQFPSLLSGYLSLGRRFGHVTVYGLYGVVESLNDHRTLPKTAVPLAPVEALRSYVNTLLDGIQADEQSASLGLRWDVYENIALKAQWSHFWLGRDGALYWTDPEPPIPTQVNVWSVGVDFVF